MEDSSSASSEARIQPGDIIAGKYRVEALIGRGGMGRVFSAEHVQLKERVALKFLMCPEEKATEFHARFLREAQLTAKLRGEHVTRLMDFGVLDDGTPFIVMEYLEGLNLRDMIRASGKLPVDIAIDYIAQISEGLAEAHARGIVHRDLKPSNIYLSKRLDGSDLVKIMDFGVSKLVADEVEEDLTAAGAIIGSPKYMAPEQLANSGDVDARADVWSLGAIFYELLAGQPPFLADSTAATCVLVLGDKPPPPLSAFRDDIPTALEQVVLRCLDRDIHARTPHVGLLIRDLYLATAYPGLDAVASRLTSMVDKQLQSALETTGAFNAFGATGSHPRARSLGRPNEPLASTSGSGSVATNRVNLSAGTLKGVSAAEVTSPRSRLPVILGALGAVSAVAIIAFLLLRGRPADPTPPSSAAASGVAEPKSAAPPPTSAQSSAPSTSAEPESTDKPVATADPPSSRKPPPGPRVAAPPEKKDPPASTTGTKSETKKPRNPFEDRF